MATLTIKIDSEELAREVLTHLNYLPEEELPDLISIPEEVIDEETEEVIDEEPVQKKELTNQDVFAFIRSKGMTLESACKRDPEFGDFIASFTTAPEKRIHGDIEPADLTCLGTDIADLDNPEDRFNVENAEPNKMISDIEIAKEDLRKKLTELKHVTPYDYLTNVSKRDQNLIVREAARALLIGMPKPKSEPVVASYDSDSDGDEEIRKLANERIKEEKEALEAEKAKIRGEAINIQNDHDRFNYIISYYNHGLHRVRVAALDLVFEFLANRNLDPILIQQLSMQSGPLTQKVYEFKESDFIIQFRKEGGL